MTGVDSRPEKSLPSSLLTETFTRRNLLRRTGEAVAAITGVAIANQLGFLDFQPQAVSADGSPVQLTPLLKDYGTRLGVDAIGYRISNGWISADGFGYMAYQGAILQYDQNSGRVNLWNTLDQMHAMGLDAKLDDGRLGVTIPPHTDFNDGSNGDLDLAFRNRIIHFGIPNNVIAWVNNFRSMFETGAYTSPGKDYGAYKVFRLQRLAVQVWKDGLIQRILVGEAYKNAGLIPQDVLLPRPDTGNSADSQTQPVQETVSAVFPKEIGNLERDGVVIYNRGTQRGVVDNKDPQNNWAAIVAVAKERAPGEKFKFFFYDNPEDVPVPEGPKKYDPTIYWERSHGLKGVANGRHSRIQTPEGIWEYHSDLPLPRAEDRKSLDQSIVLEVLRFFILKDNLGTKWGSDFAAILRQQAGNPGNTSLKVVYAEASGK